MTKNILIKLFRLCNSKTVKEYLVTDFLCKELPWQSTKKHNNMELKQTPKKRFAPAPYFIYYAISKLSLIVSPSHKVLSIIYLPQVELPQEHLLIESHFLKMMLYLELHQIH